MTNDQLPKGDNPRPDIENHRRRRADGTEQPTPELGQAAIVADPRNRPKGKVGSLPDEGKRPEEIDASNDN